MRERRQNTVTHPRPQLRWCDRCSIRIAPYEQHVTVAGRLYHAACYTRVIQPKRASQKDAA